MTLHPRSLPSAPSPKAFEIPGIAYYSALEARPAAPASAPAPATAAEVLEAMYDYCSPLD